MEFDFGGYATKNDLRCADGRTIKKNAFKSQNGAKVPLVWQHQRNDPSNVIGHAYLENRDDGVYCYCKLNTSEKAKQTKLIVEHGDVGALSIYANGLVQKGGDVMHGMIREVSVVIAGANPGAVIDNPVVQHGDEEYEDMTRAIICSGLEPSLSDVEYDIEHSVKMEENDIEHADDETVEDVFNTLTDKQRKAVEYVIGAALSEAEHSDESDEDDTIEHADDEEETVQDVYDSMTDKQKKVVAYIVGAALAEAEADDEEDDAEQSDESNGIEHNIEGGDPVMKKNAFDQQATGTAATKLELTHDQFQEIVEDAKKIGSFREAFLQHATQDYGIENIDILFPDAKAITNEPDLIKRDTEWVAGVLSETRHVPFSRVKSTAADLTADEARAKGYVKGNLKKEEVIKLLKRVTNPTTIYKKQKLDRDDIVDITDLNVVAFLKAEMRVMLNEELARAFLVGDGRDAEDEDKIDEECIRPIWKDDDLYAHHVLIPADATPAQIVEIIVRAKKYYKGSGSPSFYSTSDTLVDLLLQTDGIGRRLYNSDAELASALRVRKNVEVPVMEDLTREATYGKATKNVKLVGIEVNLRDYTVGATAGGQVSMFDDFDIDYNQYKYLLETRCSGALTMPKSAIVFEQEIKTEPSLPTPPSGENGGVQVQSTKASKA